MTLLKCKNGHKWNYNGENQSGEKATCPKCRVLVNIPSLIIAVLLVFGVSGLAYGETQFGADHIPLPINRAVDDQWCIFLADGSGKGTQFVEFTCHWRWYLPDYVMAEINMTEVPVKISDIPEHNLDLGDKITLLLEQGEPRPIIPDIPLETPSEPEIPLTFEEIQIKASIDKLDECLRGLGAWGAYQAQTDIEYFVDKSRYAFPDRDNLSQNVPILRILKAIEECDIMRTYERMHLIGSYELNKVLADLANVDYLGRSPEHKLQPSETDIGDSMVATDPVTKKDIAQEVEEMERLVEKLERERVYTDPDADYTGINRGGPTEGLKCQLHGQPQLGTAAAEERCPMSNYEAHILKNWDSITYSDILTLQCDNFLYIYAHKIGTDDFPAWLNHCVPKVVREG